MAKKRKEFTLLLYRELARLCASERAILPLKTATREKCSKVKASNSFLKRFDIWVRAGPAELVGGGGGIVASG